MARLESRQKMGYLPIPPNHYDAILSLIEPAPDQVRLIDPFAGDGEFIELASKHWNVTPYLNELDVDRANLCIQKFGAKQAVQGDVMSLRASNLAFGIGWLNPPYDWDKTSQQRVEFQYLKHSWKWIQSGGVAMWVVYDQHITYEAISWWSHNCSEVDIWALPGKHQGQYDQMIVIGVKDRPMERPVLYQKINDQKANPLMLTVQDEPRYVVPSTSTRNFHFAQSVVTPEHGLKLAQDGAWTSGAFQNLFKPKARITQRESVVPPRPGHTALVLAAGIVDGAVIKTQEYGDVAIRGKTRPVKTLVQNDKSEDAKGNASTKIAIRLKPTTKLTLVDAKGKFVQMHGDDELLKFIRNNRVELGKHLKDQYNPLYDFSLNGLNAHLSKIRLNGKHKLYTAQKHVIASVIKGLDKKKGILLVGQMGTGKTIMGSGVGVSLGAGIVHNMSHQIKAGQVILVVCPPHLIDKWQRELLSVNEQAFIRQIKRHEDMKLFMDESALLPTDIPKIGIIKRDMTKLGTGHNPAVKYKMQYEEHWKKWEQPPSGWDASHRIKKTRVPTCPHCGEIVYLPQKKDKENKVVASDDWFQKGRRSCNVCQSPLWQEKRDRASMPKAGDTSPRKNPRYRLDQYLKKVYPDRVYLLLWDEIHEAKSFSTGNGSAFARMAGVSRKVLAMTGTPFNGKSSSMFNIEYAINPRVRDRYAVGGAPRLSAKNRESVGVEWQQITTSNSHQRGQAESLWVEDMGIREKVIETKPEYDYSTGALTGTRTYEKPYREAPGISPLLVAEVLDHAIFFSLKDLGKWLPTYEEYAIGVTMDDDVAKTHDATNDVLSTYLNDQRRSGDRTFQSAYFQWSINWINSPYRHETVVHNKRYGYRKRKKKAHTVHTINSLGKDCIYAKEEALKELVEAELQNNRPCVVYVRQTGTRDIQPRIEQIVRQVSGANPYILKSTVDAEQREAVIEEQIERGVNVLICNPELVKTGIDLIHFPTLVFFEITYNLSTMMQASARAYRLNQEHDKCKVVYLYYENTMEEIAVYLMSRKQRAAKILTGDVGLTGLDELTKGEAGFEEDLVNALVSNSALSMMENVTGEFTFDDDANDHFDLADMSYWNIEPPEDDKPDAIEIIKPMAKPKPIKEQITELVSEFLDEFTVTPWDHNSQGKPFTYLIKSNGWNDLIVCPNGKLPTRELVQKRLEDAGRLPSKSLASTHTAQIGQRVVHRLLDYWTGTIVKLDDQRGCLVQQEDGRSWWPADHTVLLDMSDAPKAIQKPVKAFTVTQYFELKKHYKDDLMLARVGDTYEAYADDAQIVAKTLNTAITTKDLKHNLKIPVTEFPVDQIDDHIELLNNEGHTVVVCHQEHAIGRPKGEANWRVCRPTKTLLTPPETDQEPEEVLIEETNETPQQLSLF